MHSSKPSLSSSHLLSPQRLLPFLLLSVSDIGVLPVDTKTNPYLSSLSSSNNPRGIDDIVLGIANKIGLGKDVENILSAGGTQGSTRRAPSDPLAVLRVGGYPVHISPNGDSNASPTLDRRVPAGNGGGLIDPAGTEIDGLVRPPTTTGTPTTTKVFDGPHGLPVLPNPSPLPSDISFVPVDKRAAPNSTGPHSLTGKMDFPAGLRENILQQVENAVKGAAPLAETFIDSGFFRRDASARDIITDFQHLKDLKDALESVAH
ncbi:hypothetical protein EI94DRAFT_1805372 [Lactarius quietus]|nr:hypothetical protein EI94DRAFT_1805372 [Lactarius quietus]